MSVPLVLNPSNQFFKEQQFHEIVDFDMLYAIYQLANKGYSHPDLNICWIKEVLQRFNETKILPVTYKAKKDYGRVGSYAPLMWMGRYARYALTCDRYYDFDIVNCFPTILIGICNTHDIKCSVLKDYVKRRTELLQNLQTDFNIKTKNQAKLIVLKILFGMDASTEIIHPNGTDKIVIDKKTWLLKFYRGIIKIHKQILEKCDPKFKDIILNVEDDYGRDDIEPYNAGAKVCSQMCGVVEMAIVKEAVKFFKNKNIKIKTLSLYHDGFMIPKNHFNSSQHRDEILDEFNKHLDREIVINLEIKLTPQAKKKHVIKILKTNPKIKLICKPIPDNKVGHILDNDKIEIIPFQQSFMIPDKYKLKFHSEYAKSLKTYASQKAYLELFYTAVENPQSCVVRREWIKQPKHEWNKDEPDTYFIETQVIPRREFVMKYANIKVAPDKRAGFMAIPRLFNYWYSFDENRTTRHSVRNYPYNGVTGDEEQEAKAKEDNYYNLFNGYDRRILTKYDNSPTSLEMKTLTAFLDLGKVVIGDDKLFQFFLKCISHLIKYPKARVENPTIWLIMGQPGCGKSLFMLVWSYIVGEAHYYSTSKAEDVCGKHATGLVGNLLIVLEETNTQDNSKFSDNIKNFATAPKVTINPKNLTPYEVMVLAMMVAISNHQKPVNIPHDCRRWTVATSKDTFKKKYSNTTWKKLYRGFQNPKFIACLYDYVMSINVKDYDFKRGRIDTLTKEYRQVIGYSTDPIWLFLEKMCLTIKGNKEYKFKDEVENSDEEPCVMCEGEMEAFKKDIEGLTHFF